MIWNFYVCAAFMYVSERVELFGLMLDIIRLKRDVQSMVRITAGNITPLEMWKHQAGRCPFKYLALENSLQTNTSHNRHSSFLTQRSATAISKEIVRGLGLDIERLVLPLALAAKLILGNRVCIYSRTEQIAKHAQ